MTASGILQIALYLAFLVAFVKPLGGYMARVYEGEPCGLDRIVKPFERLICRLLGTRPEDEMSRKEYAAAAILFKLAFFFLLHALLRLQNILPLNPQGFAGVAPDLAFILCISRSGSGPPSFSPISPSQRPRAVPRHGQRPCERPGKEAGAAGKGCKGYGCPFFST